MNQALSTFGLTKEQLQILFSFECEMVNRDRFAKESVINKYNPLVAESSNKSRWYVAYQRNLTDFLKSQNPTDEYNTILPIGELYGRIREVSKSSDTEMWKYLILLECTLFQPYFPMSEADAKEKIFKGLQFDTETRKQSLFTIASYLGISLSYVARFEDSFKSNVKKMTGYWNKVLVGIGAGVAAALLAVVTAGGSIAAFFAGSGLYGAAAVSSGLAALGGGAVAAGGFGMAGGMAVLVGGGALLGIGAGGGIGMAVASTSPDAIMQENAKIWVVLKEIVMGVLNDTKRAQEIISNLTDKVVAMKKEISLLKMQVEQNKEKIKNLEKSVNYLEKMIGK